MRQRIEWLHQLIGGVADVAEDMVRVSCERKGIAPQSPLAGEEWLAGPVVVLRNLRLLLRSLEQIAATGVPRVDPSRVRQRDGGDVAVQTVPHDHFDRVLFVGYGCETWLESGVRPDEIAANQAVFYQRSEPPGRVSLVLGAGNVASIAPMDVLTKMFIEGSCCLLKMSPVNEYLGPLIERAFWPLVEAGYFAIAYGGSEVGAYLCQHEVVTQIHVTGCEETHQRIVWGPPGPDREQRKQRADPLCRKSISSELGNVSPVLVVPAAYSDNELLAIVQNVAGMFTNNASFNCNAARLLVTARRWPGRDALLARLADVLARVPLRRAYYPRAQELYAGLVSEHDDVRRYGHGGPEHLPWTLLVGVDATDRTHPCLAGEQFCPVLSHVEVGSPDPVEFITQSTEFVNRSVWGTLSATLFVHPQHQRDPAVRLQLDRALRALRYGLVAVNTWPGLGYGLGVPPWGGHPSSTLQDIQSGSGWVHNTLMLDRVEKSVLWGPLRPLVKAFWIPGHRSLRELGRRLADFERGPGYQRLSSVALSALRA